MNPAADAMPPRRPRRDWDGTAAVIAACVGLLALCVSGYTAWLQGKQVSAQVWPHLIVGSSDTDRSVLILNKGIGPAIVRSVRIYVDGTPQRNWQAVLAAVGLRFDEAQLNMSTVNGNVLSPGETEHALVFATAADFQAFAAKADRVKTRVCYCSVLGECWVLDKRETDPARREHRIDECVRDDASEFHD